jgi:hypothetical protein
MGLPGRLFLLFLTPFLPVLLYTLPSAAGCFLLLGDYITRWRLFIYLLFCARGGGFVTCGLLCYTIPVICLIL